MENKIVFVKETEGEKPKPFNITRVEPYLTLEKAAGTFFTSLHRSFNRHAEFCSVFEEKDAYDEDDISLDVYLTEVRMPSDPRTKSPEMLEAKRKEVQGLLHRGKFQADVPADGNLILGRFS